MKNRFVKSIFSALPWGAALAGILSGAKHLQWHNPVDLGLLVFFGTIAAITGRFLRLANKYRTPVLIISLSLALAFWPFASSLMPWVDRLRLWTPVFIILAGYGAGEASKEHKTSPFWLSLVLTVVLSSFVPAPYILWTIAALVLIGLSASVFLGKKKEIASLSIPALFAAATPFIVGKIEFKTQIHFADKVVEHFRTLRSDISLTKWKGNVNMFENGLIQLSSWDQAMFYEPMTHPAMSLFGKGNVLVLGGENGRAVYEALKFQNCESVTVIPFDEEKRMQMARSKNFKPFHQNAWQDKRVNVINSPISDFLSKQKDAFDLIIADLPDPRDEETNAFYTYEFYHLCSQALKENGGLVTQAGNAYLAEASFLSIGRTLDASGFGTVALRNQVPSLGQWGWFLASKKDSAEILRQRIKSLKFKEAKTEWLTPEATQMMLATGKSKTTQNTTVNRQGAPITYRLYLRSVQR
ncbi:hypothetical protein FUAX_09110 [Fulvitalea axinellae]|uniref:Polyamine aminopropyltransferase n=1 Tax=Fulvitalea axinellae TaxID=1182444 RepID=A0AAU9D239_9BACT|nr:hypothetical protein FUAX_09110 [Fulvitalea axinellae]